MTTAPPRPPSVEVSDHPRFPDPVAAPSHKVRYVVVGLVLVGALVFLVAKGLGSALNFYLPANQAVAQKASLGTSTFNLEGLVEPNSVHATRHGVNFVVGAGSTRVEVVNTGTPPQLFQVDIPVIAVGHFSGSTFVSDQILVKHSSTYIAAHPGRVTAPNGTKR